MTSEGIEAAYAHRTVTHAGVSAFATLTGDYARMHLDHHFGKASPIGGSIAHGLLSACWALGALTRHAPERLGVGEPDAVLAECSVRFGSMVYVGDTLCVRHRAEGADATSFEMLSQSGDVATRGRVALARGELEPAPAPWALEPWERPPAERVCYGDDMPEWGPRGEGFGRTVTESEAVRFATEVGETNPLYLNRVFAERARFGARVVPPMLSFCLAFSDFLDALLGMPLPNTGFAGHLGDAWQLYAPVAIDDTIRGRYRVESARPSSSRPDMTVVEFGIQVLNQDDRVAQQGRVTMLMGRRPEP